MKYTVNSNTERTIITQDGVPFENQIDIRRIIYYSCKEVCTFKWFEKNVLKPETNYDIEIDGQVKVVGSKNKKVARIIFE